MERQKYERILADGADSGLLDKPPTTGSVN